MVNIVKVTLVGNDKSGKTKLATRFARKEYSDLYIPTIGAEFSTKQINPNVKLQVWDMAGQERFQSLVLSYLRGADVIVINIALPSLEGSYNQKNYLAEVEAQIKKWVKLSKNFEPNARLILALNQADLIKNAGELKELSDKVQALAEANGIQAVVVTSAKEGTGVDELFEKVAELTSQNAETASVTEQASDDVPAKEYEVPSKKSSLLSTLNNINTFALLFITALVIATVLLVLFPPVGMAAYLATGISGVGLSSLSIGAVAAIAGAAVGLASLLLYGLGKAAHSLIIRRRHNKYWQELENPWTDAKENLVSQEQGKSRVPGGVITSAMPGTAHALGRGQGSAEGDAAPIPTSDTKLNP
jgi:small GTP-binding protein